MSNSIVSDVSELRDSLVSETWENQLNNSYKSVERRKTELVKPSLKFEAEPAKEEDGNLC
jgi:uncharacterized alpha-E superfamily protein